jgi:hypothetical protein
VLLMLFLTQATKSPVWTTSLIYKDRLVCGAVVFVVTFEPTDGCAISVACQFYIMTFKTVPLLYIPSTGNQ